MAEIDRRNGSLCSSSKFHITTPKCSEPTSGLLLLIIKYCNISKNMPNTYVHEPSYYYIKLESVLFYFIAELRPALIFRKSEPRLDASYIASDFDVRNSQFRVAVSLVFLL